MPMDYDILNIKNMNFGEKDCAKITVIVLIFTFQFLTENRRCPTGSIPLLVKKCSIVIYVIKIPRDRPVLSHSGD